MGEVRALVSGSVKSGKSVDNKKRVLSLAETRSHFVLSTDFTDFTDFLLRETWEFFLSTDFTDFADFGYARLGCFFNH